MLTAGSLVCKCLWLSELLFPAFGIIINFYFLSKSLLLKVVAFDGTLILINIINCNYLRLVTGGKETMKL